MIYEDLYKFPEGHPPSPYESPVRVLNVGEVNIPAGLDLYAVGWVEETDFATGTVPEEFIDILFSAYPEKIVPDGTRGVHTCTLCNVILPQVTWKDKTVEMKGYGHFLVQNDDAVYMAPALILHYILDHQYQPPQEFIDAVLNGRFLTVEDLEVKKR